MTSTDKGPYSLDEVRVDHRNIMTNTIVNSEKFDLLLSDLEEAFEYEIGYIPAGYAHRPDLISNLFYGTPKNWWLLMMVNGINDPFEGFNESDRIFIPKI
tara:strand:+ start:4617 stop:4916 length:300 start_codon:yes stop_codon:yes gene_type:complete